MANLFTNLLNKAGFITEAQADAYAIRKIKEGKFSEIINSETRNTFSNYLPCEDNTEIYLQQYREEAIVYACTYLISNAIAGLPLKIYKDVKRRTGTQAEEQINHPASILIDNPNEKDSGYDLKESLIANLMLGGNGFLMLEKPDGAKIPTEIYSLRSSKVKIVHKEGSQNYIDGYMYLGNGSKKIELTPEEVIQFKLFNPLDDFYGLSPIASARLPIDTVENARISNNRIFKNGMQIDGVLETEQELSEESYKRLKEDFKRKFSGSDKSHNTPILEKGLKYTTIGITPADMDYIQGMKMNKIDICSVFLVPPILIGEFSDASYNNILEAKKMFWENCIKPKLDNIEKCFDVLIKLFDKSAYCKFDLSGVEPLQENWKDKIIILKDLFSLGIPVNTGLKFLKIPIDPVAGGDVGYLPFNLQAVGTPAPTPESTPAKAKGFVNKIDWTPEKKEAKWKGFVSITNKYEKHYMAHLSKFFEQQKRQVLANLNKQKSIGYEQLGHKAFMFYAISEVNGSEIKKAINIESILFDKKGEVDRLMEISLPIHTDALKEVGEYELQTIGFDVAFDVTNPAVVKWLKDNALEKAKFVIDSKQEELKASLIEGVNNGESIPDLSTRVEEYYKLVEDYQTERVARTEVIGASNQGALFSYEQAGVEKKGWLASMDERTRDTHIKADNDYRDGIPIDESFKVGADEMDAPAGGSLPEECINCRCTIIPILKGDNE